MLAPYLIVMHIWIYDTLLSFFLFDLSFLYTHCLIFANMLTQIWIYDTLLSLFSYLINLS